MAATACRSMKLFISTKVVVSCLLCLLQIDLSISGSFTVDFEKHKFLKDGEPFNYVSGSMHYMRTHPDYWQDRLKKMRAAGLDAVQTYIAWNIHEPSPGKYDFGGQQDLERFLQLANDTGLLVILRAGPYICAEWEYGGFPAWLLAGDQSFNVRTKDPAYLGPVNRWLGVLLPKLKPMLYSNGGPVIMVQVENEYGSYFACDHDYMTNLQQEFRRLLGDDIILFTTDGAGTGFLKCGTEKDLLTTVDFGPGDAVKGFKPLQEWNPSTPLVNSEYYTGWLDLWGGGHAHTPTDTVVKTLDQMLAMNASVNMYMFEGGTNFGYYSGAEQGPFRPVPTSYDYDSPLSEAGDVTDKYMAIRDVIKKYKELPQIPIPSNTTKAKYGQVQMEKVSSVIEALNKITAGKPVQATYTKTMEQVGQNYGFILYRHQLKKDCSVKPLNVTGVRDRGYVLLNGVLQGVLTRDHVVFMNLLGHQGDTLDILVENQGRINFGSDINKNYKGIIYNVTLDGVILEDWTIYSLNFSQMMNSEPDTTLRFGRQSGFRIQARKSHKLNSNSMGSFGPTIYQGSFQVPEGKEPADTFLNMDGWYKGQAFINGFNLGRYWPVMGPQVTLYIPAPLLKKHPETNMLLMVELDQAPCTAQPNSITAVDCTITLTDTPILSKVAGDATRVNQGQRTLSSRG